MPATDTKQTILDAAEDLFAEQGYAATSLRQLTGKARVNLAAVHYHFGSKEDLAKAVLARRIEPINVERIARLDALPARRRTVEAVVRAFVEPPLRAGNDGDARGGSPGSRLCRVFGRVMVEQPPFLRKFLAEQFRGIALRFETTLAEVLPGRDSATLWWRLHFVIGAMAHTLQNARALALLTEGECDGDDVDAVIEQLVAFAVGGLRAPALQKRRRQRA